MSLTITCFISSLAICLWCDITKIIMIIGMITLRAVICLSAVFHPRTVSSSPSLSFLNSATIMSRPVGGGANDVTRFLSTGVVPGSPTSVFSASSQADWAAKRLIWVPSEKHGFEVSWKSVNGSFMCLWLSGTCIGRIDARTMQESMTTFNLG